MSVCRGWIFTTEFELCHHKPGSIGRRQSWVSPKASVTKQYINLPDSNFLTRQLTDLFCWQHREARGPDEETQDSFRIRKSPWDWLSMQIFYSFFLLDSIRYLHNLFEFTNTKQWHQSCSKRTKTSISGDPEDHFSEVFFNHVWFHEFFQIVCEWEDFCSFQHEIFFKKTWNQTRIFNILMWF